MKPLCRNASRNDAVQVSTNFAGLPFGDSEESVAQSRCLLRKINGTAVE
jgi:hypothetical protein